MSKKLKKSFIKHCNTYYEVVKKIVNEFDFF